jgi:hypothetical protein
MAHLLSTSVFRVIHQFKANNFQFVSFNDMKMLLKDFMTVILCYIEREEKEKELCGDPVFLTF